MPARYSLDARAFAVMLSSTFSLWGRTGFDEGNEAWSACRGLLFLFKKRENDTKANDNVELALAA